MTMKSLIPYLVFPGSCKEAMEFYKSILNADSLTLRTFGDSPVDVSEEATERIFDSELRVGKLIIKASDDLPDYPVKSGTNFSLFVAISDVQERKTVFEKLSEDGSVMFPLDDNFGMLRDKFGIQWMLVKD